MPREIGESSTFLARELVLGLTCGPHKRYVEVLAPRTPLPQNVILLGNMVTANIINQVEVILE